MVIAMHGPFLNEFVMRRLLKAVAIFAFFSASCSNSIVSEAGQIAVRPGTTVEVWGDSLTFGAKPTKVRTVDGSVKNTWIKSSFAWPETLAKTYGLTLLNHPVGGLTSDGLVKSFYPSERADVEFVMIGTNDCLTHWRERDQAGAIARYAQNVERIHQISAGKNKRLIWLTFPPMQNEALNQICASYRQALSSTVFRLRDELIDVANIGKTENSLWLDGLHLTDDGYRQLSNTILQHIVSTPKLH